MAYKKQRECTQTIACWSEKLFLTIKPLIPEEIETASDSGEHSSLHATTKRRTVYAVCRALLEYLEKYDLHPRKPPHSFSAP